MRNLASQAMVLATEDPEAARLTGTSASSKWRSVQCFYFAADHPPIEEAVIALDRERLYVCGDHVETASLNGAIHSGKRAAEAVIAELN